MMFSLRTCIVQKLKSKQIHLTLAAVTYESCSHPGGIVQFSSAPCCIYLQAVPCDPAGADFNFAALSFNSELLHQIHLVPLHDGSLAETPQTLAGLRAGRRCRVAGKTLGREGGIGAILITTFPPVRLAMC